MVLDHTVDDQGVGLVGSTGKEDSGLVGVTGNMALVLGNGPGMEGVELYLPHYSNHLSDHLFGDSWISTFVVV